LSEKQQPVEIRWNPQRVLRSIAHAALHEGLPEDATFAQERGDRHLIVVAAAPRTGSTFLANVLIACTGYPGARLSAAYGTNEHDLYLPALCIFNQSGCVSQLHMKGSYHNAALLRAFAIQPIILTRNIFDVVVSLREDLRKKEQLPGLGTGVRGYSFLWQDKNLAAMDDNRLTDAIIDLAVPWYVNFYVSWYRLCEAGAVTGHWITYEAMMADKKGVVDGALDFLAIEQRSQEGVAALDRRYATYGEARTGRGEAELTAEQKSRIARLFSYYPDIEFSGYGL